MSFVLTEQEYTQMKYISDRLARDANAKLVFLVDKSGMLITSSGDMEGQKIDTTSLASLAAGNIAATSGLAEIIGEEGFTNLFHEGTRDNIHLTLVADRIILVLIFDRKSSLGLVRLRVKRACEELKKVLEEKAQSEQEQSESLLISDEDIDDLFEFDI